VENNLAIRRKNNLRLIIDNYFEGKVTRLAKAINKPTTQLSRIFSSNEKNKRAIGDKLAREIEHGAALPSGWLDKENNQVNTESESVGLKIPLISWANAENWFEHLSAEPKNYINTSLPVSTNAFALNIESDAMSPAFPVNTKVIFEPNIVPKNNTLVLVRENSNMSPVFRFLIIDGLYKYLIALNKDYPTIKLEKDTLSLIGIFVGADYRDSILKNYGLSS